MRQRLRAGCAARPVLDIPISAARRRVVVEPIRNDAGDRRLTRHRQRRRRPDRDDVLRALRSSGWHRWRDLQQPAGAAGPRQPARCGGLSVRQPPADPSARPRRRSLLRRPAVRLDRWVDRGGRLPRARPRDRACDIHARRALRPRLSRAPPDQWPHLSPHGGRWCGGVGRGHELAHAEPRLRIHRRGLPDVLGPARQRSRLGRDVGDGRAAWHRRMHRCDPHPGRRRVRGGFVSQRAVALRVDVGSLRPIAVAIGPAEGEQPREGDERSTWALTWETPDSSEFMEPTGALPDPNSVEQSFVPTPSPSPLEPEPGAWPATELSADAGANVSDVAAGDGRFVAVGASFPDGHPAAAIWTSTDGLSWEPVVDLPDGAGIGLNTVDWNGEFYLVVGHRDYVPAEGEQFTSARPETWISVMASTGSSAARSVPPPRPERSRIPDAPSSPTADGWQAARSGRWPRISNVPHSSSARTGPTGRRRARRRRLGSLGTVVALPDGSLLASGCESPGGTNSGRFGEACYQRPWRSDDGTEWTPGEISDLYVADDDALGRPPHRHRERVRPDSADGPHEQAGDVSRWRHMGVRRGLLAGELGRRMRSMWPATTS